MTGQHDKSIDFARHLRKASTPAEDLLWYLLRNRQRCKMKFRRQHPIGPYICDFYCAEVQLVVECDGMPHFTQEGIEKDKLRTRWLNGQGIHVIRFTSHEIDHKTQEVLGVIDESIKQRLGQGSAPHHPAPSPRSTEEKGS